MLVFEEGENRSRKTSRSRLENQQQTQSTYDTGSNPGHIGGRRALSLLRHLCSPGTTEENPIDQGQPRRAGGPYIEDITRWREDMNFIVSGKKMLFLLRQHKIHIFEPT